MRFRQENGLMENDQNAATKEIRKKIDRLVKPHKKQLKSEEDKEKRKALRAENKALKNKVEEALKILSLLSGYNLKLYEKGDAVLAGHYDGLVNYSIVVLNYENEIEPSVTVSCKGLGRGLITYNFINSKAYKTEDGLCHKAFADLFDWVIAKVRNAEVPENNSLSYGDIKISTSSNWKGMSLKTQQPVKDFKRLIDYKYPDISEEKKRTYYTENSKMITGVNPLQILRDMVDADYSFERKLRQLVIRLAKKYVVETGKSLESFFFSDKKTEAAKTEQLRVSIDECETIENVSDNDDTEEQPAYHSDEQDPGDDYNVSIMNECVEFGEVKTALNNDENEILSYITNILEEMGKENVKASFDENGVIRYSFKGKRSEIKGYVGQVFLSESKLIKTKFLVERTNYWFVPEYRAFLEKKSADEKRSLEERTILTGYISTLKEILFLRLTADLVDDKDESTIGITTSLNGIYRKLYEARFNYDFLADPEDPEEMKKLKLHVDLPLDLRQLIVETFSRKVRYPEFLCENTMSMDALIGDEKEGEENEYYLDGENIFLIDGTKGYFDPGATSSGKTQGSARYLVEDAVVNPDGTISPSKTKNDRTPVFKRGFLSEYSQYNPFDRNQMVFSNLMSAYSVTKPVKTALMTCGGWNMEDAFVISKRFAETYQVPKKDKDGNIIGLRPLKVGDKMLDRGGNKGVISVIVDPDGTDETLKELTKLFHDNDLDVLASPYSGLSRFNGATARELMKNSSNLEYRGTHKDCIGEAQYIITRQFADKKTKIYDESDYKKGKSRQASAQLSWALCSKDAREMLRCLYKDNERAVTDLRDVVSLVNVVGSNCRLLSPKVRMHGFDFVELAAIKQSDKEDELNKKKEKIEEFLKAKEKKGVNLTFSNGDVAIYILPESCRPGYRDYADRYLESDITKQYREILMSETLEEAKKKYEALQHKLSWFIYEKDNIFKTRLMTRSVKYSATAIWTPDPRLPIESIAISKDIADALEVKKGDYLLIWRDPVLRDSNVRYMIVERIDEDLTGIAINPVMAKGFDGDFDGDTVAVVKISYDKKAHKEAIEKFSVEHNLIDEGRADKPLCINTKLDLISAGEVGKLESAWKSYVENKTDSKRALEKINEIIQSAFKNDFCLENAMIRLSGDDSVIDSLQRIRDDGAKKGEIGDYEKYFKNTDNALPEEERIKVQKATAIKAAVGIAGRYSQQLMRAFREICPKAVLELTYPNTQALLQVKHNPKRAVIVYKLLKNELMDAWEMKQEGRIERIKELYNSKENLDQPIGGENGIDEKYLIEIDGAMGDEPLSKISGTFLDKLAYQSKKGNIQEICYFFEHECSTDKFINNRDSILNAVAKNSETIRIIPEKFLRDEEIVLETLSNNGYALRHLKHILENYFWGEVRNDIIFTAISNCGYAIDYVKENDRYRKELLKAAIENHDYWEERIGSVGFNNIKDIVLEAVKQNGLALEFADPELKKDFDVVKAAVSQNGLALEFADPVCQDDINVVKAAVVENGKALRYSSPRLRHARCIVFWAVSENWEAWFSVAPLLKYYKNDTEIVSKMISNFQGNREIEDSDLIIDQEMIQNAISQNGLALYFALPGMKKQKEVVIPAVQQNGLALQFADPDLQDDIEVAKAAVQQNGLALQFADPDLQDDIEVVKAAVQQNGLALHYASPRLKMAKCIVHMAVSDNGEALQFAHSYLKDDDDIVKAAVSKTGKAFIYASGSMRNIPEIALAAIPNYGCALGYASYQIQIDKDVVQKAVANDGLALEYAPNYQDDRDIVTIAVENNGLALKYAPYFQDDRDIVCKAVKAVKNKGLALKFAPVFQNDPKIVSKAVEQNGLALEFAPAYQNTVKMVRKAVSSNGLALQIVMDMIKNDKGEVISELPESDLVLKNASKEETENKEFVLNAVSKHGIELQYASKDLRNDRDVVMAAVENDGTALRYASDNLKNDRHLVYAALTNDYRALKYASEKRYSDCFISKI